MPETEKPPAMRVDIYLNDSLNTECLERWQKVDLQEVQMCIRDREW